jgi:predicted phage terminase large subunit-like protein
MSDFAELHRAVLRQDFLSFAQKCALWLNPQIHFIENWHLESVAWHLEEVRRGRITRLIINLPPRSLKSIMASIALPAFWMGHRPSIQIICASYGFDLATKLANDFRSIIESAWYKQLFPGTRPAIRRNSEVEVATTRHGFRLAASVGGTLTGRGADAIIIDDPLKANEASSQPRREEVNQWFINTVVSRLNDKRTGAIVVVMQRLHLHDLVGFLTSQLEDWTVLSLPAIAQTDERVQIGRNLWHDVQAGEALQPQREPLEVLEHIQRSLGPQAFAAQYLQAPIPEHGAMIDPSWFPRYSSKPEPTPGSRIVQSWDPAEKPGADNSYSACSTWQIEREHYYLVHVFRGRFDYCGLQQRALELAVQYKPSRILVEDTGTGAALSHDLRKAGRFVTAVRPTQNKVARLTAALSKITAGVVHLPKSAPWLSAFETELFTFPDGAHDDQVDTLTQVLNHRAYSLLDYL